MLPPNCKTSMSYKPRSGTFRKVKYPIAMYKEGEVPRKDFEEMLEMANRIKTEDPYQAKCLDVGDEAERKLNIAMRKTMKLNPVEASSGGKSENTCHRSELPQPEFSIITVDIYSRAYPDDNSMPPFPVTSCADFHCSSDSEESVCESDYDMDSEDEEWLQRNQDLNITPNRLEYIFSKLNKRNTHVPEKAIGALPESMHSDFYYLFPYWKEKRLENKNSSSFRRNFQQADGKLALGYVSTDPYVTFAHKVRKSLTQQSLPPSKILQKLEKVEEARLCFKRMAELREKLENFRSYAFNLKHKGLNNRDKICNHLETFTRTGPNNENLEEKFEALPMPVGGLATRITRRSSGERNRQSLCTLSTDNLECKSTQGPQLKLLNPMVLRPQKKNWKFTQRTIQKLPTFELIFSGKHKRSENTTKRVRKNRSGAGKKTRRDIANSSKVWREP